MLTFHAGGACAQVRYYGKELGALSQLQHGVRGRVFAVDSRTLYVKDLHYDGEGPAAYFYVGTSGSPSAGVAGAVRLRDERGGAGPLRRYHGDSITLSLPDGKTLRDYRWFAVYCDEYAVNFGDVRIPADMEYPRPAKVAPLRGVHGVSSDPVVVVDAQTLLVPNFSYDGEAPDAKFWVGRGDKPSPQGIRIPDENGKEAPLRKYDKKTIVLTLPGVRCFALLSTVFCDRTVHPIPSCVTSFVEASCPMPPGSSTPYGLIDGDVWWYIQELTVFDIGHFAVWCEAFTVNFGHVSLPRAALANVPPSLKMLGVSPQECMALKSDPIPRVLHLPSLVPLPQLLSAAFLLQSRNSALAGSSGSAGSSTTARPRRPIARLDATTYRPPARLRPGAPRHLCLCRVPG
ncbi:hypothetical protein HF086_002760 [Spodoptera exigua]|uniref:DM13 domain-containing protein n=1 Tax=Spodoptera exigua TaxID=7107 RepID=A0A922MAI1_SPOEX|nr:hypothetical protein HF086_002760 [Spodoptera exigua]